MDPRDNICVSIVPQLGAGAVEQASGEEHRAVAAVEDERLAAADAVNDLPAA
jgi:hypothetical protein